MNGSVRSWVSGVWSGGHGPCRVLGCVLLVLALARRGECAEPTPAPASAPAVVVASVTAAPAAKAPPAKSPVPAVVLPPYEFQPGVVCPMCEVTPDFPQGRRGLHWHSHWQKVGLREYISVGALTAGALAVKLFVPPPDHPRWNTPILFDTAVRNALRIDTRDKRRTAEKISDALFVWEVVHPSVIDPLLVAWWARDAPTVAWQMMVIDAQAYSLTILVNDLIKRAAGRARPWVGNADCAENEDGPECGSGGRYVSFYSGHAAVTATGAGLICAHHTQLSLYRNDVLDTGMCGLAVLGTALTGAMRIASDNHWATDVLVGHLLGYTSGYLLPTLLYYKEFRATPHDHPETPSYATLPMITTNSLGLMMIGMF